jgi:hypothetical protein
MVVIGGCIFTTALKKIKQIIVKLGNQRIDWILSNYIKRSIIVSMQSILKVSLPERGLISFNKRTYRTLSTKIYQTRHINKN